MSTGSCRPESASGADLKRFVENVTTTSLQDKALAVLGATLCMVALPAACFFMRSIGPAARVVYYPYFPFIEIPIYFFAVVLGAALGKDVHRWLRAPESHGAPRALPRVRLAGLALLGCWIVFPNLVAFPASGSIADRDAWARSRVGHYAALAKVVRAIPEVQRDVGRIVAIAPTAHDEHVFARTMDGDEMRFAFDVIGERGKGTFLADCTLDEYRVYDWRPGRWTFRGHETRIEHVSELVPR
jgi:hypothetical protein